eukprot:3941976-Rhodomonas_salina.8
MASCEYDFVDYFCTCPEDWTTKNQGFGIEGCVPPPVPCDAAEEEELCPVSPNPAPREMLVNVVA